MMPKGYMDRTLKRFYSAHQTPFNIQRFEDGNNPLPNLYGERIGKSYGTPIACLGYIETDLTELRLAELGWHKDMAEFLVKVPFILLVENELALPNGELLLSTDDLLEVPSIGKKYKLSMIDVKEPFINGTPLYVYIGGRKFTNGR
jgi:hypothetical protein